MSSSSLPLGLPVVDETLATEMRSGLGAVEEMLRETVSNDDPFVSEAASHLIDAGGKRFRAMLVLLAAQFGADPHAAGVVPAAAVVELTHVATLYHDDVMDEAPARRGRESANSRWSNTVAILAGDYLFARASDIVADLGPEAVRVQARAFSRLVQGQIRETAGPPADADEVEHYIGVVADKTGSLIATAGRFGAMLSGAPDSIIDTITDACERIGVAFQLSDDLLDVASEFDQSGKAPGTDLREGVLTLPVLHAKASSEAADGQLRELLASDLTDPDRHARALRLLRESSAMERARADLHRWVDDARVKLATLPAGPAREALEGLCDFVLGRTG